MGELFTLQPRHYRRSRVSNLHGCAVLAFPEKSLLSRANLHSRQASEILALSFDLYSAATIIAFQTALRIAGLHPQQDGASYAAKKHAPSANTSAEQS